MKDNHDGQTFRQLNNIRINGSEDSTVRRVREQSLVFAEFAEQVVTSPSGPASHVVAPEAGARELDWERSFRYLSREQQFVETARELVWETAEAAVFVPFQNYWPTYEQMNPQQKRWYLYWRGEVRAEHYPDTDLSYLFVYLYELIHGFGWSVPAQGAELMRRVWAGYRERYPKLDGYIREWMYDFAVVFRLEQPDLGRMKKIPRTLSPEVQELEWKRRLLAEPIDLNWELLRPLIDYEVEKSKFYTKEGRKEISHFAPKVVALVDGLVRKRTGKRLLELYLPPEKKVQRFLFRSAVYDHEMYGRTTVVVTQSISGHLPLRRFLTQLVRLTENKLRELTGVKGKLRGVEVDSDIERLVTRYLEQEFERRRAEKLREQAPKVKLNTAKLRKLQQESDEVRELLLSDDPVLAPAPAVMGEADRPRTAATTERTLDSSIKSNSRKPGTGKVGPDEWMQPEFDFEQGWAVDEEVKKEKEQAFSEGSGNGLDVAGAWTVADLDLDKPEAGLQIPLQESEGLTGSLIPGEWKSLLSQLTSTQREMLLVMVEGADAAAQFAIAERAGSMPELLHDEINELAMEAIGDLLIDGGSVLEEYSGDLGEWLKR
ncbi:TerB N-terminal domain-containing protein [Paenibacillus antibioticophila]|uniref:TerB N-terminal domain-containing protein n=1 Tax=Paenibacillus antibioticophila TaxID=1274374 RepID=UPI000677F881|nr:TerB N-terminal domain-containing protein [Paenibacillus antibioticophila]